MKLIGGLNPRLGFEFSDWPLGYCDLNIYHMCKSSLITQIVVDIRMWNFSVLPILVVVSTIHMYIFSNVVLYVHCRVDMCRVTSYTICKYRLSVVSSPLCQTTRGGGVTRRGSRGVIDYLVLPPLYTIDLGHFSL